MFTYIFFKGGDDDYFGDLARTEDAGWLSINVFLRCVIVFF